MPRVDPISLMLMLPLLGAAGAFLLKFRDASIWAGGVVAGCLGSGTGVAVSAAFRVADEGMLLLIVGGWQESVGIHLRLDGAAAVLLLALFLVSLLVLLYAIGEGGYGALFYATYAVAVAAMAGVLLSADLFNLFVFFEVLSLAATILIAYKRKLTGLYAAFRYLMVSALSVVLYLTGLFLLYRQSGELALEAIFRGGAAWGVGASDGALPFGPVGIAGVLLFTGVAIRAALVPFHAWLPDAHSQAPHPVSALLSGLVIKAAFLALWRIVTLFSEDASMMNLLLLTGVISALLGVILAMAQHDAKRLLAFHSISQMGYIAAAAGAGALTGALYHAVGHALFKSLLFLVVGYYIGGTGSRDLYRIGSGDTPSSPRRELLPPVLLVVGAAAIAGVPPLTGFVSKALVGDALKGTPFYPVVRLVSIGTAASFIKLCSLLLPAPGGAVAATARRESGSDPITGGERTVTGASTDRERRTLRFGAMGGIALLILFLGLFPSTALGWMEGLGLPTAGDVGEAGFYTPTRIWESVLVLVLGALVAGALLSGAGKRITQFLSRLRLGLDGALGVMALGVILATLSFYL